MVMRLGPDGRRDIDFGTNGEFILDFNGSADVVTQVVEQPDGKILAIGYSRNASNNYDWGMIRILPDGSGLDTSFGIDGRVQFDINSNHNTAYGLHLFEDGTFLVSGYAQGVASGSRDFSIRKFQRDGSLDSSWGPGEIDFSLDYDEAFDMKVDESGRVLLAGRARNASTGLFEYGLVRLTSDGTLDPSFGTNGKVTIPILAGDDEPRAGLEIQADGKILVAGQSYLTPSSSRGSAIRLNQDGSLDESFGTGGVIVADALGTEQRWNDLELDSTGRIVLGGWERDANGKMLFTVHRYQPSGIPDASFGDKGVVRMDTFSDDALSNGIAITRDNDIIAVGQRQYFLGDLGVSEMVALKISGGSGALAPLAELDELQMLSLSDNNLVGIQPLANLQKLESLDLDDNFISSIDSLLGQTIIDNGDSGYVESGNSWAGAANVDAFEGDYRLAPGQAAETAAVYQFSDLEPGQYTVYTTWPEHESRTGFATYQAYTGELNPSDPNQADLLLHLPLDFNFVDGAGSRTSTKDDPTFTTDHRVGIGAAQFDGGRGLNESQQTTQTDAVVVEAPIDFDHNGLTFALWVKLDEQRGEDISFRHQLIEAGDKTPALQLFVGNDGTLGFYARPSSTVREDVYTLASVDDGQWHHVAAVLNVEAGQLSMFIDGVQQPLTSATTSGGPLVYSYAQPLTGSLNSYKSIYIGSHRSGQRGTLGKLDDVRIYAKAFDASEVAGLNAMGSTITQASLVSEPQDQTMAAESSSNVLWSQPPEVSTTIPNIFAGVATDITGTALANDFRIDETTELGSLRAWLADVVGSGVDGVLEEFSGTLGWAIYSDDSGLPGTLLYSGSEMDPLVNSTNVRSSGGEVFAVDIDFPPNTSLPAGTYWLSIRDGAWGSPSDGSMVAWWDGSGDP